jgi:hypothetical protein
MALSPSGAPAGQVSAAAGGAHDLPSDVPSAPDVQAPDPSPPGNATGVPPLPTPPLPDLPQP